VGDVFLLCSDGLTGRVSDAEIGAIIGLLDPETSAQLLVDMANLRGGSDNITAVVVQVTGDVFSSRHQKELTWKMSEPQTPPPAASAGWWLALGLAILSALLLLGLQQQLGAILAGLAAAGAAIGLGYQRLRARRPSPRLLGDGPYENVACRVDTAFTASILETMEMMLDRLALPANEYAEIQAELAQVKGASVEEASICQRCADLAKRLMCAVREEMQSTSSDSSVELF
jgi:protein phosphatase